MKKRIIKSATHVATYDMPEAYSEELDNSINWKLKKTSGFYYEKDIPPEGFWVFPIILLAKYDSDLYLLLVSQYDNIENYVAGIFFDQLELFKINED